MYIQVFTYVHGHKLKKEIMTEKEEILREGRKQRMEWSLIVENRKRGLTQGRKGRLEQGGAVKERDAEKQNKGTSEDTTKAIASSLT